MITGRELIAYIMANHLEDKPVFDGKTFIGFKTVEQVAREMGTGVETVRALSILGFYDVIDIKNTSLIPLDIRLTVSEKGAMEIISNKGAVENE